MFGDGDRLESVAVDGNICGIFFQDITSPNADTLAIWTVGVDAIIRDIPYPDPAHHGTFYGVFAPSNPTLNHHVDGFSQFDHYHVTNRASENPSDDLWDPMLVFPGPNFNAATYQPALSFDGVNQQIAAGVLSPPITTIQAGFGPVVFHGPIDCGGKLWGLYQDNLNNPQ